MELLHRNLRAGMLGVQVHWFSILNSLMVVLVMSSIVAMIMMRTIRRDLARYEGLLGDASARPPPPPPPPLACLLWLVMSSLMQGLEPN